MSPNKTLAVCFQRGNYVLFCFERFVKTILNNTEASFTRPYNELTFLLGGRLGKYYLHVFRLETISIPRRHSVSFIRILKPNNLRCGRLFSFVGKFALWKNMFLLDLQKSSQQIKLKIKTWYWPLTEVSNLKLPSCLTCSVSRMKW